MRIKQFLISLFFVLFATTSVVQASGHPAPVADSATQESSEESTYRPKSIAQLIGSFWETTGINAILDTNDGEMTAEPAGHDAERPMTWFESSLGRIIMIIIVFVSRIALIPVVSQKLPIS